jgi:hypothetical protein
MAISQTDLISEMTEFFENARRAGHCIRIRYNESYCTAWSARLDSDGGLAVTNLEDVALGAGSPVHAQGCHIPLPNASQKRSKARRASG